VESDWDNDGFFVEHGYLSADEGSSADDDDADVESGKKGPDREEKPPRHSNGGEPDELLTPFSNIILDLEPFFLFIILLHRKISNFILRINFSINFKLIN
jgi:hypothetical protein